MNVSARMSVTLLCAIVSIFSCRLGAAARVTAEIPETTTVSKPHKGVTNFTCLEEKTCVAKTPGHWWVGTEGGLVRLDEKTLEVQRIYTPADGLAGTMITALAADGNVIWVGAISGISRLDAKTGTIRTTWAGGAPGRFEIDRAAGRVWALSDSSAVRFDKASDSAREFMLGERCRHVARDGDTLWGSESRGQDGVPLIRLDTATGERTARALNVPRKTSSLKLVVGKDEVWALTEWYSGPRGGRLIRIDKKTLKEVLQGTATGLSHDDVQDVIVVGSRVWARTSGEYTRNVHTVYILDAPHMGVAGRLCRYDRLTDRWRTYPALGGFKNDEPTCFAELDGDLWVATRAFDKLTTMVIGWGMMPITGKVPEVEALALNRFLESRDKWRTYSVPVKTNFDRIIAMTLQDRRLWFLIERTPIAQSWKDMQNRKRKVGLVAGYIDTELPQSRPVLFEENYLPLPATWQRSGQDVLEVVGNAVWVCSRDQLWQKTEDREWRQLELDNPLPGSRASWLRTYGLNVLVIAGRPFASFAAGVLRFEPQSQQWSAWRDDRPWVVTELCVDPGGTWWLSASMKQVYLPDDSERKDEDRKPLQGGLFRSKDGVAWEVPDVAPWTWQQQDVEGPVSFLPVEQVTRKPRDLDLWGLSAARGRRVGARRGSQCRMAEGISCVESDGKRLWVGTFGDGVFCLEKNRWRRLWPKSARSTEERHFVLRAPEDTVVSMVLDGDSLWIATMGGLRRYRISENRTEKVRDAAVGFKLGGDVSRREPHDMLQYGPVVAKAARRIWFSCYGHQEETGIYCRENDRQGWNCVIPGVNGLCFAEAGDVVWIGTRAGLLRYNPRTDQTKTFTVHDGLVGNRVQSVALDDRFIWVGTGNGISRLDKTLFQKP